MTARMVREDPSGWSAKRTLLLLRPRTRRIGREPRVRTDGRGDPANALAPHSRHRPAFRQSAILRHGDEPHRACGGEADPEWSQRVGILEEYRGYGDRYAYYDGCAPDPDRPLGGGFSSVRADLDL